MFTLSDLYEEIRRCRKCPLSETRKNAVPGEGNPEARIALIAQAPGEVEDQTGEMFVGRSGKILDSLLDDAGVERDNFYLTNLIKCFLPGYRRPKRDEIDTCSNYLDREIEIVKPEFLVPLGYYPARYVLKKYDQPVPEDKPEIFNRLWYSKEQKIFPLGHPATLVYDKSLEGEMREDYKKLNILSRDCKWYDVCPMKRFYQDEMLDRKWVERYCRGDWESCKRFKLEESGEPHPDWMLPDGTMSERLKKIYNT
jgi:DNA polymerase